MSAPAPDPPNPNSNEAPKPEDSSSSTTPAAPTDDDVQMKDEPGKAEEEVKEPEDKYEDIPDHVMSVSIQTGGSGREKSR